MPGKKHNTAVHTELSTCCKVGNMGEVSDKTQVVEDGIPGLLEKQTVFRTEGTSSSGDGG